VANGTAWGANSGVDHGDVDAATWENLNRGPQQEGAREDVLRRHGVGEINDRRVSADAQDGGLDLADVRIGQPKISKQTDQRHAQTVASFNVDFLEC
jgi:hypothetical protein